MDPNDILGATDQQLAEVLQRFDADEVPDRIRRLREVNEILAAGAGEGFWHSGGEEASWLLGEAKDCYIFGLPLASLLASHAACERRLAGLMASYPDDHVPSNWEMWGLARLGQWAQEQSYLSEDFVARLKVLGSRRNAVGHFRRPISSDSVISRVVTATAMSEANDFTNLVNTIEADARHALHTAYDLYFALGTTL